MHRLTFFPIGNADCCRIDLHCGKKMLFDYADCLSDEDGEKRIDLPAELKKDLGKRDYFDVVAFTHLDRDHICGSPLFFWLQHNKQYQGEGRIKMNEMWVPAAVITEDKPDDDDAKIIQAEARYRLKNKKDIRIFSRPERLKDWLEKNGLKLDDVRHLITDAGQIVAGFSKDSDGVEFFAHSPFAKRMNEREVEDRNQDSLVVQATFVVDTVETKVILAADTTHEMWADIVDITKAKKREFRLEWDVIKLPHHCSYLSLGPERGTDKTNPVEQVEWLYKAQGQSGAIIISTSNPIPDEGTEADKSNQPPHRQAANYYRERRDALDGEFVVTMEHPSKTDPKPVVIKIDQYKATLEKVVATGAAVIVGQSAPRAGNNPRAG